MLDIFKEYNDVMVSGVNSLTSVSTEAILSGMVSTSFWTLTSYPLQDASPLHRAAETLVRQVETVWREKAKLMTRSKEKELKKQMSDLQQDWNKERKVRGRYSITQQPPPFAYNVCLYCMSTHDLTPGYCLFICYINC